MTDDGQTNVMVINSDLSDEQAERVILHELGHYFCDDEVNYKSSACCRMISESKANSYMIKEKIKNFIDLGNSAETANWLDLAKSIGTCDYSLVIHELKKYC